MSDNIISCENLVKIYKTKEIEVIALQGLDLAIEKGELMAIIGNSGSGKSTFLNMIGGLDRPSAGKLFVDDKDLFKLNEKQLVEYKRNTVGFVWQNNARNLIPYLTAVENIQLPMVFGSGVKKQKALELLELVGMSHRKNSKLSGLSGGEQQRIAIALALANNPKILLADEPTGSVDTATSNYILDVFKSLNEDLGVTVVIVTHDTQLSKKVNRVVAIRDGKNSSEMVIKKNLIEEMENIEGLADTQEEYAVLDRAGRVQIPSEMLKALGLNSNKIKVELEDGKIVMSAPKSL
jgi:ABC-type lipoprotein export system ATPase subunit